MGQEQSSPIDDSTPPQTLKERSVESLASYIKEGHAQKVVVMVSFLTSGKIKLESDLTRPFGRQGLASLHLRVFQISDLQTLGSMRILHDSTCLFQRLSLTYHFSETIHYHFTLSPTNYIPANTGQPFPILLSDCFRIKASC